MKDQRYYTGEDIHIGDQVTYGRSPGTIVFVIDRSEYSPEFPAEHWSHYATGFMIQCDSMGLVMLQEPDEDLELLHRATANA